MAAPNLVNVTSIYGKTYASNLTTSSNTAQLTCASNKLYKVNTVLIGNIDGTNAADVYLQHNDGSSNRYKIAEGVSVPAKTTLVIIGKDSPIYLEEGQILEGWASANSDLSIVISYEILDDA